MKQERYGDQVVRFLSFTNDEDHELGQTSIPGGDLKVYRTVGSRRHLSYVGQSSFKYIPVSEEVELNLGAVEDVVVEPTLMSEKTDNYRFDRHGNVAGWDDVRTFEVKVRNTRDIPAKVEIQRHFDTPYWTLAHTGESGAFEKVDADTVKFTLQLPPRTQQTFVYSVTCYRGTRQEDWSRLSR